ncbi:MAG: NAD(P)H-hydrate dehydratase [Solirubrobacterales bacterium]
MRRWFHPVYDAAEMRATDEWAISECGIPSRVLMEAAGRALASAARDVAGEGPARVVCGKGNNGGDGFVAARILAEHGERDVEALCLWPLGELSDDALANAERVASARHVEGGELAAALEGSGVVVDSIFGTGFEGTPRSPIDKGIEAVNRSSAPVVSADIASGVNASSGEIEGAAVDAEVTVAFHAAKRGHHIAPGKWNTGELRVADIGIPAEAPVEPTAGTIDPFVLAFAPRRGQRSTKFTSGQVVVIGASRGLSGAARMSARAAMRAGAGYVTCVVPASLEQIFEIALAESMTRGAPDSDGSLGPEALDVAVDAASRAGCAVLGPGLGSAPGVAEFVRGIVDRVQAPLLVDASAFEALAGELDRLAARSHPTILPPHAGELATLLECESGEIADRRLACATEAAGRSAAVVVLKGDGTLVVGDQATAISTVASPALATAGTGDVLAGTIGALVARGMDPFSGACAGVVGHARAGRAAARRLGAESVTATDVIESLPAGLRLGDG